MASTIDPTLPDDTDLQTADLRSNFSAAKTDIEAIQSDVTTLQSGKAALADLASTDAGKGIELVANAIPVYNVDDYYTSGDYSTAVTAAMTAATGGGITYIPASGTTRLMDTQVTILDGAIIWIDGYIKADTTIRDNAALFKATNVDFKMLGNGTLDGDSQRTQTCNSDPDGISGGVCTNGMGVWIVGACEFDISGKLTFVDFGKDGIYAGYDTGTGTVPRRGKIDGPTIKRCHRSGIAALGFKEINISNVQFYDIYEADIDIEIDDKTPDNEGANCNINNIHSATEDQTLKTNTNHPRIDVANQEGGENSWVNISNWVADDVWTTVVDTRSTALNMLNITTTNTRVNISNSHIKTNAVTSANAGLINLDGVHHVTIDKTVTIEHVGAEVSNGVNYALQSAVYSQETNEDVTIDARIIGKFNRPIWVKNMDYSEFHPQIDVPTNMDACIYMDGCDGITVRGTMEGAGSSFHIRGTSNGIALEGVTCKPNTQVMEYNGTAITGVFLSNVKTDSTDTRSSGTVGAWSVTYTGTLPGRYNEIGTMDVTLP